MTTKTRKSKNPFRTFREDLNVTQRVIAERLGKTVTTISNWETGATVPPLVEATEIAAAYGVEVEDVEQAIVAATRVAVQAKGAA